MKRTRKADHANPYSPTIELPPEEPSPHSVRTGFSQARRDRSGLSIAQLMLVALVMGICGMAVIYFRSFPGKISRLPNPPDLTWRFAFAFQLWSSMAIPLACLTVMLSRWTMRQSSGPFHPGHLFIALAVIGASVQFVILWCNTLPDRTFTGTSAEQSWIAITVSILFSLTSFLYTGFAIWGVVKFGGWYRAALAVTLAMSFLSLATDIHSTLVSVGAGVGLRNILDWIVLIGGYKHLLILPMAISLIAAMAVDVFRRTHRDTLHWTGVCNYLFQPIAFELADVLWEDVLWSRGDVRRLKTF